ncbi:hypothetical protein GOP47_0012164 [Adiantum capillus-veneris]|uniref:VQ domain-containing protein n=1 Tax=Adiantum capillus-veneris TaxID=13818 RepID=A0A9D4UQ66_ADICA|nr:hypothetical protein GOP47_0012164 [Adiantum capillus-veneris]
MKQKRRRLPLQPASARSNEYSMPVLSSGGGAMIRIVKIVEPQIVKTDAAHFRFVVHSLTGLPDFNSTNCRSPLPSPSPPILSISTPPVSTFNVNLYTCMQDANVQLESMQKEVEADNMLFDLFNNEDLTLFPPLVHRQTQQC